MDPVSVAASLVALFGPMLGKASEGFAGRVGEALYEKAEAMYAKVKSRLTGDEFAEQTVRRFEAEPDRYATYMQDVLTEALRRDLSLARELAKDMSTLESAGPDLYVVQRMREARSVVGVDADEITSGGVRVEQEIDSGSDITGAKIGRMGTAPNRSTGLSSP